MEADLIEARRPARRRRRRLLSAAAVPIGAVAFSMGAATPKAAPAPVVFHPVVAEYHQETADATPPTEAQCQAEGRRCFTPQAIQSAYDLGPLYAQGLDGSGVTIAVVDSYGSDTITHDLHVFDQAFGLQPMCGEDGVTCGVGMPTFSRFALQGTPSTTAQPSNSNGTGQEDKAAWALETSLDVETAHAIAPMANILLVTTPTAETFGVQGFPDMMNAEQYVVDHHMASVISQSFAAAEESFGSSQSLQNLRHAYISAAQNGVTVLGSSGDNGTANVKKQPTKTQPEIPYPTVVWPASDPLVTGVGGTYLCTDPTATTDEPRTITAGPPAKCEANPSQAEVGWTFSGGGFSHVFTKPGYQDTLPAGSTAIGSMRGVPDVGLQASAGSGALVYVSLPPDGNDSNVVCNGQPCSSGWYDIGGTSLSCPQWAGIVAIADQLHGGGLGLINPRLYAIGADASRYASDFYDVTTGNNTADPNVQGYPATPGWDPITGLGTPNAANLVPDLAS